jgi:flagellar hook-associated protein 2
MPTITFGGVGSGIDTESIISGLLSASKGPINRVQLQQKQAESAVSSVSDVGSLLSKLKDSLLALDSVQEVGSFKVASDNKAIVASANGAARAGSFQVTVESLASAYKAYSDPLGVNKSNIALGQEGTLSLSVAGNSKDVEIEATDTLDQVISKINASGLRVSATSFFDGTSFRLQVRGLDTGSENDVTLDGGTTTFNFTGDNVKSNGEDAVLFVDEFRVTSKTNQVQGIISGVTLALTEKSTTPVNVTVSSDPESFQTKLKTLVDSYNAVVTKVNAEAGFGSIKASNPELSGDSSLRSITTRLNSVLTKTVGTGKFQSLRSIGIELNNNGTLKLNTTTLNTALTEDPEAVTRVLAGDDGSVKGITDILADATTKMLAADGTIQNRKDGLSAKQRLLADRVQLEQKRLDRMEEMLRKQFTEMDSTVAANQARINFLQR